LFTRNPTKEIRHLKMDVRNCAVLESACNSTVCDSTWINVYIDSRDDLDKNSINKIDGRRIFKI
jgi:hypothetical protein